MPEPMREPLVVVKGLSKTYVRKEGFFRAPGCVMALDHVDLAIPSGGTLALAGQSGSGKSTLARCLARLEEPDSGEIWFRGQDILRLDREELRGVRRQMQLIFQDPASALNPRFAAWEIVAEPLEIERRVPRKERRERALEVMEQVELARQAAGRSPAEFSGGQRQRLAIARALVCEPKLLILDEALSALDLLVQRQIVDLLLELQSSRALSYLFITHDLSMAAELADEAAVLFEGRIVERGPARQVFREPRHAHTQQLLAAVLRAENGAASEGRRP